MKEAMKIAIVVVLWAAVMIGLPLALDACQRSDEVEINAAEFGCKVKPIGKGICIVTCSFAAGASCTCQNGSVCHCYDAAGGHQVVDTGDVCPE